MTSSFLAAGAGSLTRRRWRVLAPAILLVVLTGCGSKAASTAAEPSYGSLPSFLPSAALHNDAELTGSSAHPAVTSQGDSVHVQLADASVHATVTGPVVPGEGLPVVQEATTCTWTITLTGASKAVPIRAADFTAIDHLGKIYRPYYVPGRPVPPATLAPGASATFELRAVMNAGEGLMRWAPTGTTVASWDFEVEND
ncbi:hypothetical protein acdb102_11750 [Acidothermaceae bacterium B102]|nr:hypothetical protein acdb102_11750 [Acidothermaceae bacterium B102]